MRQEMQSNDLYDRESHEEIIQPPPKKEKDPLLGLLGAQVVVSCLALAAALVIQLVGGKVYRNVRDKYTQLFCDPTSASEVLDALSGDANSDPPPLPAVTETTRQAMATVTQTDITQVMAEGYGDSADDSLALKEEEPLLMNTAVKTGESTNNMAVPVQGTVTSPFGYRIHPIYGTRLFHNGVDIGADSGTPIVAALSGTVETATYNDSYGYYIIIDHGNDFRTVYAHCSELTAEQGQQVEKGETIALVGSTGVSTGPHLHFEVRRGEYRINPEWLVDLS